MELPLLPLLLVLLAALLAGRLASRLGFPSVLGELAVGILLGPPVLGLLTAHPALDVLAQLGIILMMLYIGMEIDPAEMQKASVGGFLAAIGGFATPFVLCFFLITATGGSALAGVFVGMAAGVTSLATKSRILADLRLLDTRVAHVMMAGALIADTISLVIFAGILGLAEIGSFSMGTILLALGKAVAFFGIAFLVGRFLMPRLGSWLADSGRGPAFAAIVVIGLVFAEGAHLAGMHGILGAFVAGLFLGDSVMGRTLKQEVRDLVRDASVRFLAPVFFVTAGFSVSLDVVTQETGLLLAVIGLATLGKVVGTALFYLPTGNGWREGLVIGAAMNGRGAVEIIVAQIGLTMGLISQEIFSVLVFMAIATTATVPIFLKLGTDWLRRRGELVRTDDNRSGALIVGAGPLARVLARSFGPGQARVVDRNPDNCDAAESEGITAVRGDALDERVLAEAGASGVRAFISLTGNAEVDALAARMARETFLVPDVFLPAYGAFTEAHQSSVHHLRAETLFGSPINPLVWDFRIERGDAEVVTERAESEIRASALLAGLRHAGPVLPLSTDQGGRVSAFHGTTQLLPGQTLTFLRSVASDAPTGMVARLIQEAPLVDLRGASSMEDFLAVVSGALATLVHESPEDLATWVSEREHMSSTVLERGIAVPHIRLKGSDTLVMVLARSHKGVRFPGGGGPVSAAFVLASTDDRRGDHLRALAAIARMVSGDEFLSAWMAAPQGEGLRAFALERYAAIESRITNKST